MSRLILAVLLFINLPLVGEDAVWINAILPRLDAANGPLELVIPNDQGDRSGVDAVVVDRLWAQLPAVEQARALSKRHLVLVRVTELGLPMAKRHLPPGSEELQANQLLRVYFKLSPVACPEAAGMVSLTDGRLLAFWWEGG